MLDDTVVGRMELVHPDLGHEGGSALHTKVRNAWTSLSDNSNSRYESFSAIADSTLSTHRHAFGVDFAELGVLLYTGTYPNLTRVANPSSAGWTIVANGTNPLLEIDVTTPASGGPHDFVLVVTHGASASGGGSGTGEINYILNPDAEIDASDWVTYADAAQSTPENGVDGTANITFTAQDTVALRGNQSFKISKDAVNRQGEGVSYDFAIAEQDKSKKLKIQFDFKSDEDAGYTSNDLTVYVYDVDNSTLITPVDTGIVRGVNIFQTSFNSTTSTNYRLIFHIATTNALAYDVYLDNIIIGPGMTSQGAVVGAVEQVTMSGAWTGTYTAFETRVGEWAHYQVALDLTATPSGNASIILPAGRTINTAKLINGTDPGLHSALPNSQVLFVDAGVITLYGTTRYVNTTTIGLQEFDDVTAGITPNLITPTNPFTWASGDIIRVCFSVPILEWEGKAIVPMLAEDNLSEWVDFTPTFDNDTGTPTVDFAQKRRLGSNLEMKIRISNANSNGSNYRLNLPDSLTPIADNPVSGVLFRSQITNVFEAKVATDDIEFLSGGAALGSDYTFTSETLEIDIKVPVIEYQGSQNSLVGYSLYNPDVQTGLVDSRGVKGHTDGNAITAGYVGEVIQDKITSLTNAAASTGWLELGSIDLTAGVWLVNAVGMLDKNGATTTGTTQMAVNTISASSAGGTIGYDFVQDNIGSNGAHAITITGIIINISAADTYYLNTRVDYSAGTPRWRGHISAVRIA